MVAQQRPRHSHVPNARRQHLPIRPQDKQAAPDQLKQHLDKHFTRLVLELPKPVGILARKVQNLIDQRASLRLREPRLRHPSTAQATTNRLVRQPP